MFSTLQEVEGFFNNRRTLGIKPGLERIHELLANLGHPERKMKAIHVAGTNGKGSTIQFLRSALEANNYETGIFTSPSFTGLTGHIFLNDEQITEIDFITILNEMYPYIEKMDEMDSAPTEFEILTALAFVYFSKNGEIILIETGMGGRFDTTNSFQPILSIITNIAIDHTEYLGETVEEIADHKAGIIKKAAPVIVGGMDDAALEVIINEAENKDAPYYVLGKDFHYEKINDQKTTWKSPEKQVTVRLSMHGEHQLKNMSIAFRALEELEKIGFDLNWENVIPAIEKTIAPGRFERLNQTPTVIVDAAHNPDGIRAFIDTANKQYPSSDKHVIVAMFADKDTKKMLELLGENFTTVTLTSFDHPRAAEAKDLYDLAGTNNKNLSLDWKVAIKEVMQVGGSCFITGSLHFITLVRNYFQGEK